MFAGRNKNSLKKRGISLAEAWHNGRIPVAYHSQRRGITVAEAWHNSHGVWHITRTRRGITLA